jgi:hypothetical protein
VFIKVNLLHSSHCSINHNCFCSDICTAVAIVSTAIDTTSARSHISSHYKSPIRAHQSTQRRLTPSLHSHADLVVTAIPDFDFNDIDPSIKQIIPYISYRIFHSSIYSQAECYNHRYRKSPK